MAFDAYIYGALFAELCLTEANRHDVDALLPKLIGVRTLDDATQC